MTHLERTDIAQQDFDRKTGEIPIVVSDSAIVDMFQDNTPIEATCDTENPESCESCT